VDARWEQEVFPDGQYAVAGCISEDEMASAEGMLVGYESIRDTTDAMNRPPEASDHLRIEVDRANFTEWDGEAWEVNEAEWRTAMNRATVLAVAELVADWRSAFFDALIDGQQPHPD
jgi:hypothetical protein